MWLGGTVCEISKVVGWNPIVDNAAAMEEGISGGSIFNTCYIYISFGFVPHILRRGTIVDAN